MNISGKVKEAETYYEMGLFEESLSVYEKILYRIDEPDCSTKDMINGKISDIKAKIESMEQDNTNTVSSEDIVFVKDTLSISDDISGITESASVFKELGLFKEAIAEYEKLFCLDYPWEDIVPDLVTCFLNGYESLDVLDRAEKIIGNSEFEDKDKAKIIYRMGQEIGKEGQMELAFDFYQSACHFDTQNDEMKNDLQELFLQLSIQPRYEYLVKNNILTAQQLKQAVSQSEERTKSVESILLYDFKIALEDLAKSLSLFYNLPFKSYDPQTLCPIDLMKNLDKSTLMKNLWVPLSSRDDVIEVLIDDPDDLDKKDQIRALMDTDKIDFSIGIKEHIEKFVKRFFNEMETAQSVSDNEQEAESKPLLDATSEPDVEAMEERDEEGNIDDLSGRILQADDRMIKIINEEDLKKKEKEFIYAIKDGLDWSLIKSIFKQKYWTKIQNHLSYQQGNIVIYNNEVAYKFDFEVKMPISVMIDRTGDSLNIGSPLGCGEQFQPENIAVS